MPLTFKQVQAANDRLGAQVSKLDAENVGLGNMIDRQRRALAQIIQVCLDNEHVDGVGAKMALAFVRDVASKAGP